MEQPADALEFPLAMPKQRVRRGEHVGDRYVRVFRPMRGKFERQDEGHLVATEEVFERLHAFSKYCCPADRR